MRYSRAKSFDKDWEYEQVKKEERKKSKGLRENRKNKRSQWKAVE